MLSDDRISRTLSAAISVRQSAASAGASTGAAVGVVGVADSALVSDVGSADISGNSAVHVRCAGTSALSSRAPSRGARRVTGQKRFPYRDALRSLTQGSLRSPG